MRLNTKEVRALDKLLGRSKRGELEAVVREPERNGELFIRVVGVDSEFHDYRIASNGAVRTAWDEHGNSTEPTTKGAVDGAQQ